MNGDIVSIQRALPQTPRTWGIRAWLNSGRVEIAFTCITFVTMIAGWLAERLGMPEAVVIVLYVIAYVTGGTYGLQAGLASLRQRTIDVDLLMVLAALGAALVGAYFEGAMLLFLFSLSNVMQNYALDRTRSAIEALMALRPSTALVRRGTEMVTLPITAVQLGDRMLVKPGDRLALDGVVVAGNSSVDQAAITGESIPVHKRVGDMVLAGTINQRGSLEVEVTHLAQDSTLAKLIRLVEEAQSEKARTQRFIEKAERYYALGVIILTGLAIAVPLLVLDATFEETFYRAMTLMVAASPCALVISTPVTVLSAIGNGARHGVLFKGGAYVEQAADIKVVAFDKTGTLTIGQPRVVTVRVCDHDWDGNEAELLTLAASVETKSEHPLAQAIVDSAESRNLTLREASDFISATGMGVRAIVGERTIAVGNRRYFGQWETSSLEAVSKEMAAMQQQGQTVVIVAELFDHTVHILGALGIADVLRDNVAETVAALKSNGIKHVVMLTGDNARVAQAIGQQAGMDDVYAELMPADKMTILKQLSEQYGPVAMVGDGVNDAPALASATIGIAMGAAGTDVALETADIVLMGDDLARLPWFINLSRRTRRTLIQNLVFATAMIVVLIAATMGFGLALPLSVVGHEGSTVLVSLNGLRLLV